MHMSVNRFPYACIQGLDSYHLFYYTVFTHDVQIKKTGQRPVFHGPEGNRTPVRKPIHRGISHHSRLFDIPSTVRQPAGLQLQ